MNEVAFSPNAISLAERALTNAATASRARAIIASTSCERPYGPPRCTLRATRWSVTAASDVGGNLRAGGVVEKQEVPGALERRKLPAELVDWKCDHA